MIKISKNHFAAILSTLTMFPCYTVLQAVETRPLPVLTLSAADLRQQFRDGDPVSEWKTAEGMVFKVPTVAWRGEKYAEPVFREKSLNGQSAVFFKAGSALTLGGFVNTRLGGKSFTIFLVCQSPVPLFGLCGNNANGDGGAPRLYLSDGSFIYDRLENNVKFPSRPGLTQLLTFEYDAEHRVMRVYRNGKLQGSCCDVVPTASFCHGWLTIPFRNTAKPHEGEVARLQIYDRVLSLTQRETLEKSLLKTYRISDDPLGQADIRQTLFKIDSATAMTGSFDGSYDPASPRPPSGQSTWNKIENAGMKIRPNQPAPGLTMIHDSISANGGANLGFTRQHRLEDWGGSPETTPYEYTVRTAIRNAGIAQMPNLVVGFNGEGGKGKSVALAWYRAAGDKYLLAFLDAENMGPLFPISDFNWNDGKFHTYTVKKYTDPVTGRLNVQALIDGQPQLPIPLDYQTFSATRSKMPMFCFGTLSPTVGEFILDGVGYGALHGIPARAIKSNLQPFQEPVRTVALTWQPSRPLHAESDFIQLRPNRKYLLTGHGRTTGSGDLTITVRQFRQDYPEAEPPATTLQFQNGKLSMPFYVRQGNNRIKITVSAPPTVTAATIENLTLTGGGVYHPSLAATIPETVPSLESVRDHVAARAPAVAKLEERNGRLRIVVNGLSQPPLFHMTAFMDPADLEQKSYFQSFRQAGIRLHDIMVPTQAQFDRAFWTGKNQYDFKLVDDYLWRVLRSDPDAMIMLAIVIDPYRNWGRENPDEVCLNQFGQKGYGVMHLTGWGDQPGQNRFLPSVFSRRVREDCREMLRQLISHVEKSEAGKAVIGYYILGFNDADFGPWATTSGKEIDDYSPAAVNAFRQWLRQYYRNDENRLRLAWNNPAVTFAQAAIPSAERRKSDSLLAPWFDAKTHQDIADFNRFYWEELNDLPYTLCRTVKEFTHGNKLVLTYIGTPMHGWNGCAAGFRRAMRDTGPDMLVTPADYGIRLPGYPGGCDSVLDSMSLHSKLFLQEQDWRSFTRPTRFEGQDFSEGRADTAADHNAMVRRECGMMLARGHGATFFELSNGSFEHPDIMKGVAECVRTAAADLQWQGRPEADLAFFLGDTSDLYLTENANAHAYLMRLTRRHRPQWDTSGVPYHLYLQSDLTDPRLPKYKVYVFLSPQYLSPEERNAVEKLKRDGHTLVFLHGPGLIGSADPAKTISTITGIKVKRLAEPQVYAGRWLTGISPLLKGLTGQFGDRPMNWPHCAKPASGLAFAVDDHAATPLATYRDNKEIAFAARDFGTWKSIYCAVPWLEADFIHNLAAWSQSWRVAAPHDAVYANQHLLTIHAMEPGLKRLTPRYPSKVTDLTTGKVIAEKTDVFEIDMPFGQTRWFALEPVK